MLPFNFIKADIKDNIGWNEYQVTYDGYIVDMIVDGRNEQVLVYAEDEYYYFNYAIPFYIFTDMKYSDLKKSFYYNAFYNSIEREVE